MDDPGDGLVRAIDLLREVADSLTADEARDEFDDAVLQVFWREWPGVSGWAGQLWRGVNHELAPHVGPPDDQDDIGGSG